MSDAPNLAQLNMMQRGAVLAAALDQELSITQQSFTTALSGGPGSVINIPLRNIGLVKKFTILIKARVRSTATEVQTLQPFGPANFFSNVTLTDLSNQTRISTTGWHLHYVASARKCQPAFASYLNDSPTTMGSNVPVIKAPATLNSATEQDLWMVYEVPCSYSDTDLRGAIYANAVNATWNMQVTVNNRMFVASTDNGVGAMYKSATGVLGQLVSWTMEVYQHFLENLPVDANNRVIIPMVDTAIMYRLENTTFTGLVSNQELGIPFANMRQFLSTFAVYDNNGTLNPGTDINYFGIQTANTTNLFKRSPHMLFAQARDRFGDDLPPGMYYFDHRNKPVETSAYGNMQLTFQANSVLGAQSQMLLGYEYFAEMNMLTQGGAIAN